MTVKKKEIRLWKREERWLAVSKLKINFCQA